MKPHDAAITRFQTKKSGESGTKFLLETQDLPKLSKLCMVHYQNYA
jgi:hypothetical protein